MQVQKLNKPAYTKRVALNVFAPKKDGVFWCYVGYRKLDELTKRK